MHEIQGKVAVVTGASSGIGKAIAQKLARTGAYVCLVGRDLKKLEALKREDKTVASNLGCYQADLAREHDLRKLTQRIIKDFDRIDILVHSAGSISMGPVEDASIEDLDRQFSVNVRAPYYLTQKLLGLLRQSQGQIVFMNSSVALRTAAAKLSQYTLTKYALRALADSLRDEVNSHGIRVISVYPGQTATPMQNELYKLKEMKYEPDTLLQPDDIASVLLNALMQPRTAEITDLSIRPFHKSN
jgi:NADP-dependent 3-hydroxy acid dehydrogenase YdfG